MNATSSIRSWSIPGHTVRWSTTNAGSAKISIRSDLLLHGSEAIPSKRRRCGLTLRFCPPEVRGLMGWNKAGIFISGSDPERRRGNPAKTVETEQA